MKKSEQTHSPSQEPIGIVISHGPSSEQAPTFFAYVWGPDPDSPETAGAPLAA